MRPVIIDYNTAPHIQEYHNGTLILGTTYVLKSTKPNPEPYTCGIQAHLNGRQMS